jgi:hypothetical protein
VGVSVFNLFSHLPNFTKKVKGWSEKLYNHQKIHQILSSPLTGEDKGGGEILEIFLLKFYLLNEKEKTKTLHQNPPMKLI